MGISERSPICTAALHQARCIGPWQDESDLCGAEEGERTMELRVWSEAHVKKRSNTPLRERGGGTEKEIKEEKKNGKFIYDI